MDAQQTELNRRNIDALVQAVEHQGKAITNLEKQIVNQAQSLTTLGNQLRASQVAMANAASTMGSGSTER